LCLPTFVHNNPPVLANTYRYSSIYFRSMTVDIINTLLYVVCYKKPVSTL